MPMEVSKNFLEVFEMFITSQTAKGVADITIRNYRYNMKNMKNYFDAERPFDAVTKRDIEAMVVAMRKAGLAHNTIANPPPIIRCSSMLLPNIWWIFCGSFFP